MTRRQALAIAGVVAVLVFEVAIVVVAVTTKNPGLILLGFIVLVIVWLVIKPKRPG
jgi:hypothetical protein